MPDHGFDIVPPTGDAPDPAATAPTAEAKVLINLVNQRFGELTRQHKEDLQAAGADIHNKLDPRVQAIETQHKAAAEAIKDLDVKIQQIAAARSVIESPANAMELEADRMWSDGLGSWVRSFFGHQMSKKHVAFMGASNAWVERELEREAGQEPEAFDPQNAVSAGGLHADFGPGAGVWARPTFERAVTKKLVEFTALRQFARVIPISSARYVGVIRNTNRDTIEATQEGTTPTQQTQKDRYEERPIVPYEKSARPAISRVAAEDSIIPLEREIRDDAALDFAVDESSKFTNGDGGNEPHGYAADGDVTGVNSRTAGTIDHYDATNLMMNLRPFYRNSRQTAYAASTDALTTLMLEEDGFGRRLWQPSNQEGVPSLLNGWRYFEATELAAVATASKSLFFANWPLFYRIVDRRGTLIIRDELTSPGLIILNMSRRYGGRTWLVEAGRALTTA